jgi:hypothetical protein
LVEVDDDFAGGDAAAGVMLEFEGEDVGGAGDVEEGLVELGHAAVVDDGDGEFGKAAVGEGVGEFDESAEAREVFSSGRERSGDVEGEGWHGGYALRAVGKVG